MITREMLSEDQELALQYMLKFVKSTNRQMILQGYAGTGKSSLMQIFLSLVNKSSSLDIICTAPTNEAVRVISKLTGEKYSQTIYSLLGLALVFEDDKEPKLKTVGTPKISEYDIVIIDESSMIDRQILSNIEQNLKQFTYVKVIYVGDDAQLPPIKDVQTGLKCSQVFSLKNKSMLTTVMRTANDNPIINVVTIIRNNLLSPEDKFERVTKITGDHGIEFYDSRDKFMEDLYADFLSDEYKQDNNYVRAIAYTNNAVNAMNIAIRKKLFGADKLPEYVVGENLIVDEPITERINSKVSKIVYTAGERLRVLDINEYKDDEFGYRTWHLKVVNYEEDSDKQKKTSITVIHKEDLDIYQGVLEELATKSKMKMFQQAPDKNGVMRNLYTKAEAWGEYFRFKEHYSWVKYAYSLTVHKSQGSTVRKVYVVERDINRLNWDDEERNKLKYVAFTRASHVLNILQ